MRTKALKPAIIVVLVAIVLFVAYRMIFFGSLFSPKADHDAAGSKSYSATQDDKRALEEAVQAALDADTIKSISEINVSELNGEYSITIRVVAAGGFYFPEVIEQTAQPFFDKAEELGLAVDSYKVTEYSKNNAGEITDMITWNSKDGVTGTYSDDTGSEPYIKTGATVDDIRDMVK